MTGDVPLTARRLNRATLARQLLLEREPLPAVDAVRRVVALQAQEPASPYIALWNRVAGFDATDLDAAYKRHAIVKATLLRITLHAVTAEDYPAFHHAMASTLRGSRLHDRRYTDTGLTVEDADAMLPDVIAFMAEPRTNADVLAWLDERFGVSEARAWWALRTFAPVVHAATGAAWSHGPRPAYVAAPTPPFDGDPAASVQWLVRRYLEGFGPASPQDLAQFTLLRVPVIRAALDAIAGDLVTHAAADGRQLYDVAGATLPDDDTPAPPRLMAMWDSTLLAYADRSRVIPQEYRPVVIRRNGDVLPTLLVDGYVAGVWRPLGDGIEVTAFRKLRKAQWDAVAGEARALLAFLADRDPQVYRRYGRWWTSITGDETRVLGTRSR
ncbi:MAG TPA: winged helix DNA-binding domain-containing protein [Acidimicrobiales bacterium]|nr:winged helix DNA-binding domain-containing protein [Acidimicrobiales bacterium]